MVKKKRAAKSKDVGMVDAFNALVAEVVMLRTASAQAKAEQALIRSDIARAENCVRDLQKLTYEVLALQRQRVADHQSRESTFNGAMQALGRLRVDDPLKP